MSRKYKFRDQSLPYFVTFATVNWVDVFSRACYCELLIRDLKYAQIRKGLLIHCWCIMPSHIHMIIGTEKEPMQNILRDFKSHSSRSIRQAIKSEARESRKEWMLNLFESAGISNGNNKDWQFWQQQNHPLAVDTDKKLFNFVNYIHFNPIKAGYVDAPEHWIWSSAKDYAGTRGLLDIDFIGR